MKNVNADVAKWHEKNMEHLSKHFGKITLRSDVDAQQGGSVIEIEAKTLVASITFWNKGDVSVLVLKNDSQIPINLDDRVLSSGESVSSLLDGYLREILLLEQ